MRGPGFVLHLKTETPQSQPPHPGPLPRGGEGTVAGVAKLLRSQQSGLLHEDSCRNGETVLQLLLDLQRSLHQFDGGVAR